MESRYQAEVRVGAEYSIAIGDESHVVEVYVNPGVNPGGGIDVLWSQILSKPPTFPPDAHGHPIADVTGLQAALDTKAATTNTFQKASANNPNEAVRLDGAGLVPAALLPSFVDDVLEYANLAGFPASGETGKIYVALNTNLTYRWSGSAYVEISASPGSTDAVPEGATNLYYTDARVASRLTAGLTGTFGALTGTNFRSSGSFRHGVTSRTAAATLGTSSPPINLSDATSAAHTITLPSIGTNGGYVFTLVKVDASANAVTLAAPSGGNINGAASVVLARQWDFVTVVSTGVNNVFRIIDLKSLADDMGNPISTAMQAGLDLKANVSHNHSTAEVTSGQFTVAQGGTGRATGGTAHGLVATGATATGAQQTIAAVAAGSVLKSTGVSSLPGFSPLVPGDISGSTAIGRASLTASTLILAQQAIGLYQDPNGTLDPATLPDGAVILRTEA